MALNQDQTQKLQRWLQSKGVKASCEACGANDWTIGDVVSPPIQSNQGISIGGPSIPMVSVICGKCAYVRMFAAVPIGLIQ